MDERLQLFSPQKKKKTITAFAQTLERVRMMAFTCCLIPSRSIPCSRVRPSITTMISHRLTLVAANSLKNSQLKQKRQAGRKGVIIPSFIWQLQQVIGA
jgi:hypothetical protein